MARRGFTAGQAPSYTLPNAADDGDAGFAMRNRGSGVVEFTPLLANEPGALRLELGAGPATGSALAKSNIRVVDAHVIMHDPGVPGGEVLVQRIKEGVTTTICTIDTSGAAAANDIVRATNVDRTYWALGNEDALQFSSNAGSPACTVIAQVQSL